MRIGYGYDVHKLVPGRPLILGGIEIPYELGLDGHSDADVLLHAISDAMLGAAALGDIGLHFPDTEAAWKGADSKKLLAEVNRLVRDETERPVEMIRVLYRPELYRYEVSMRRVTAETGRSWEADRGGL